MTQSDSDVAWFRCFSKWVMTQSDSDTDSGATRARYGSVGFRHCFGCFSGLVLTHSESYTYSDPALGPLWLNRIQALVPMLPLVFFGSISLTCWFPCFLRSVMAQSDSSTGSNASLRITLHIFVSYKRPHCAKMATILDEFHFNSTFLETEEHILNSFNIDTCTQRKLKVCSHWWRRGLRYCQFYCYC